MEFLDGEDRVDGDVEEDGEPERIVFSSLATSGRGRKRRTHKACVMRCCLVEAVHGTVDPEVNGVVGVVEDEEELRSSCESQNPRASC